MRAPLPGGTIDVVAGVRPFAVLALAALLALAVPVGARADDGDDVRVERACSARSTVRLRVRVRGDDELRVEITVRTPRRCLLYTSDAADE